MISILDYGLGNLKAFTNTFNLLNIPSQIVSTKNDLLASKKIIFPGVGTFDNAIECLNKSGLRDTLDFLVLEKEIHILGICVAMQLMANESEEGKLKGLQWIPGKVEKIKFKNNLTKHFTPHMGWNDIKLNNKNPLFAEIEDPQFYFLHSYHYMPIDNSNITSITQYGQSIVSSINYKNIHGVQFHPEKSHKWGKMLLRNFAEL